MAQTQEEKLEKEQKPRGRFFSETFNWIETLMGVLVVFVVVFTFFVRLIGVQGSSMVPTLDDHNIMLVSNLGYTAENGDIIILRKDGFYNDQPIVKRVIATGGDVIDINSETGDVSVNGEVLEELYIAEKIDPLKSVGNMTYPIMIPEGSIFVMGDNRNHSTDSRWTDLGVVDERYIIGHVITVVYPFNRIGTVS